MVSISKASISLSPAVEGLLDDGVDLVVVVGGSGEILGLVESLEADEDVVVELLAVALFDELHVLAGGVGPVQAGRLREDLAEDRVEGAAGLWGVGRFGGRYRVLGGCAWGVCVWGSFAFFFIVVGNPAGGRRGCDSGGPGAASWRWPPGPSCGLWGPCVVRGFVVRVPEVVPSVFLPESGDRSWGPFKRRGVGGG